VQENLLQRRGVEFSEKVRWRMRHDRNPLLVTLQDKYRVRAYAESRQVATPELLHVTEEPESIPFDRLPNNYFIKANHGWGWNILCLKSRFYRYGNGKDFVKSNGLFKKPMWGSRRVMNQHGVVEQCNVWLKSKHRPAEWAYHNIPEAILIEKLLEPNGAGDLKDYRMYTFNGKVRAINVGSAIYRKQKENAFFDTDWNPIALTQYKEKLPDSLPDKPKRLEEMIRAAERLGEGVDFVRVDLYDTTDGVILGEVTIYPDAGNPNTPTSCPVFNTWLGDQWVG